MELFRCATPVLNAAGRAQSPVAAVVQRCKQRLAHVIVINLMIPATDGVFQLVFYFGVYEHLQPTAGSKLLERFINASDAFRSARLKLIPCIVDGPWPVRQAVTSRPALLGKALHIRYFRTNSYFECSIDCNSSPSAGRVVSLVKTYARDLVVDLAFISEHDPALPLDACGTH